ncbi:putative bifunctional diguanylate cyclase/phosphodiesterase [Methylobacterium nodulans]|uniref:Diguanylate cyclase/phosphodiesterase with PAS/PAC sensor(S) n=1 Tax=Methylobacterium nodulans (strain LMG 21967 / CNCM I-2342 / ORS 2060) TaxID=460265 RepID=B8IC83_METNO|nr:EAL domain-containing protein [Methylobacterium nodulans]ACL55471.1 diguanylate cyclase/phosphodiesterase with PAS/PAC sensor(s) [Methylobacterium nodulans ORS 2060]
MLGLFSCLTNEHIPHLLALNVLLAAATAFAMLSFLAAGRGLNGAWTPLRQGFAGPAVALFAAGFAALHLLGPVGTVVPGRIVWDTGLAAGAVLSGTMLAAGAIRLAIRRPGVPACIAASFLLALGLCGLQVLALAAASVVPDAPPLPTPLLSRDAIAGAVAAASALLLAVATHGIVADARAAALRNAVARLRALTEASFEGIVVVRDGRVLDVNPSFCALIGRPAEALRGEALAALTDPDSLPLLAGAESPASHETRLRCADGTTVPVEVRARPWSTGDAAYAIAVRSLRERHEADRRIRMLAYRDQATSLPNRAAFDEALRAQITACVRNNTTFSLHRIDLDRFKDINITFGHALADQVLAGLARRLAQVVEAGTLDRVFRLGDDEFAVLQIDSERARPPETVARQIVEHLAAPVVVADRQVQIRASVGVAVWPEDGSGGEMLLKRSGLALDRAKRDGGGRHCRYDESLVAAIEARRRLQEDLAAGLRDGAFTIVYLPIVSFASRRIVGHEALLRWRHPRLGEIPPSRFIPLAEECGAIVDLGQLVLAEACRQAATWTEDHLVAVNVSGPQLQTDDFIDLVDAVLRQTGLPPERLQIEVTEAILIDDRHRVAQRLRTLRARGVRVALDDFGKGLSSLQLPRDIPFDAVKLDVSIIRGLVQGREQRAVVEALIGLLHHLGRVTVAEGVETREQWEALRAAGCDLAQGVLFGTPRAQPIAGDVLIEPLPPAVTRLSDYLRRRDG